MTCLRCHGFMVQDRLYDLLDAYIHTDVWRCTNCGNVTDTVILTNRQAQNIHPDTPTINQAAQPSVERFRNFNLLRT